MELSFLKSAFAGKKVFLTGHTGFKGAWMLQILAMLGADIKGYSLAPKHEADLYNAITGDQLCDSVIADIRDLDRIKAEIAAFQPDFVFHLAAQALVRRSYASAPETFAINVQGTANVLEAMKAIEKPCIGVMITTDKVYENPERGQAFVEDDKLGGYDPYSASKAAAEIVIDSYRRSFFHPAGYATHGKSIAAARAGNVIGGGDWSEDRIVPDIVRAIEDGRKVILRNPQSVRPWQHVLEPVGAYLWLAAKMAADPVQLATAFNFGPDPDDTFSVEALTKIFLERYGRKDQYEKATEASVLHEANLLTLDSTRAHQLLGWKPQWNAGQAISFTADWYAGGLDAREQCAVQINNYFS